MQIGTRLDHIRAFMERRSGRQLVFEYCTPTGEERMGNLEEMTADNGEFLRVLSGNLLSEKLAFALDGHGSAYEQHLSDRRLHDRIESIVIVHSVTSMLCISSLTDTPDRSATKEKCVPC